MRDWIMPLVPVMAIAYFIANPHQFGEFVTWVGSYVH